MSQLTVEEVRKVAKLANLSLTEAEVEKFRQQLAEVLKYIELLNEVAVESVSPTAQTTNSQNVFREDKVDLSRNLPQKKALGNASNEDGRYFVAPAVF
jgi:aspartyl-tRNA(Asn)/glutamyl-tRNA(Gln) amidotransferase subunit C